MAGVVKAVFSFTSLCHCFAAVVAITAVVLRCVMALLCEELQHCHT